MESVEGNQTLAGANDKGAATSQSLPLSRSRRRVQRIAIVAILLAGLAMLVAALLSSGEARSLGFTAAAGTLVAGIGAAAIAEALQLRVVGALALLSGVMLVISALVPVQFAGAELSRLLAGIVLIAAAVPLMPRASEAAPAVRL